MHTFMVRTQILSYVFLILQCMSPLPIIAILKTETTLVPVVLGYTQFPKQDLPLIGQTVSLLLSCYTAIGRGTCAVIVGAIGRHEDRGYSQVLMHEYRIYLTIQYLYNAYSYSVE